MIVLQGGFAIRDHNLWCKERCPSLLRERDCCATKKESGAGDGGAAWGATSVLRVRVEQVCEL